MLKLTGVTKRFGGLTAVDQVDLEVGAGEIFGIMGPNGAGKTTLFNLITGFLRPTSGAIEFDGQDLTRRKSFQIARLGVVRTFQNIQPFGRMTVAETVSVAQHHLAGGGWGAFGRSTRQRRFAEEGDQILELVGLAERRDQLAQYLAYGDQRRLELARALATRPQVMLLDEPAAGLNPHESEELIDRIGRIRGLGKTIVLIEHDMDVMMSLPDRIAVLNFGKKIAAGTPAEVQANPLVIEAYLGQGYGTA